MEFDSILPGLSGVAGGVIASWLVSYWSRRLPATYNFKSRAGLLRQHRAAVSTANVMFFVGLLFGVSLYWLGSYADTDYRPILWAFGLASVLPLIAISLVSLLFGRNAKEAYVAFSWGQGSPIWATYGLLGAGIVAFFFAVASLGT